MYKIFHRSFVRSAEICLFFLRVTNCQQQRNRIALWVKWAGTDWLNRLLRETARVLTVLPAYVIIFWVCPILFLENLTRVRVLSLPE